MSIEKIETQKSSSTFKLQPVFFVRLHNTEIQKQGNVNECESQSARFFEHYSWENGISQRPIEKNGI